MRKIVIVISCIVCIVLAVLVCQYVRVYVNDSARFPEGETVNGVNCSDCNVSSSVRKITDEWNSRTYVINQNGRKIGRLTDLGLSYDIESKIKNEMYLRNINPVAVLSSSVEKNLKIPMKVKKSSKSLDEAVDGLAFLDRTYKVKTANAYVEKEDTKFTVIKEVYGDNIDKNAFKKAVISDISKGDFKMDYNVEDYYAKPTVKADSEKLKQERSFCKKYLTQKITYKLYSGNVTLKPKDLARMIKDDGSGKAEVDEKAVRKFSRKFAVKYSTLYLETRFKTTDKRIITVHGGNYGYDISSKKEAKLLLSELKSGKDVTREPAYSSKPSYHTGKGAVGDSYVEISVPKQTLWMYKNGKKVLSTSVVTGNVKKNKGTPEGVYKLAFKQSPSVLRGTDYDGAEYESKVTYWMPFNGGIGMHDASWRGSFGGSIYLTSGSHGCVNMPTYAAAKAYSHIVKGYPIVVYYE